MTIYAIGDVHGCADELEELLSNIRPEAGDTVVFLGDYIDRGPDSRRVVEIVRGYHPHGPRVVALKGNHEDIMLQVDADESKRSWWYRNGGDVTVKSFGGEIPADVLDWANNLPTSFYQDGVYFCHAGIYPGVPLAEQTDECLMWIRDEFLDSEADHGALIVHGHTPINRIESRSNRANVDHGCVYGDFLACLAIGPLGREYIRVKSKQAP